eukprot:TRINITY_DN52285_c0_g1_i1.p1 TRINITY_DN52285_c0_g1~~TRINITY_DN52285_c0_g1_i1.p1  ORF type:complete len:114 (-),score=39.56 TRINITY_DN52285_c0_g1_i1:105-446(-)
MCIRDSLCYICKANGLNMQHLGRLRSEVKEVFAEQLEEELLLEGDLAKVLFLIDELIVMRTVKAMVEWQVFYAAHDVEFKEAVAKEKIITAANTVIERLLDCLLYTSPSPRDS